MGVYLLLTVQAVCFFFVILAHILVYYAIFICWHPHPSIFFKIKFTKHNKKCAFQNLLLTIIH